MGYRVLWASPAGQRPRNGGGGVAKPTQVPSSTELGGHWTVCGGLRGWSRTAIYGGGAVSHLDHCPLEPRQWEKGMRLEAEGCEKTTFLFVS